jgi:hypothetical protein
MSQIIEILVARDGSSRILAKGFAGNSCLQATRLWEECLGAKLSDELTAEFYRPIELDEAVHLRSRPS